MREIKSIIETSIPPNRTDVGWLCNGTLKFFTNGSWKEIENKELVFIPVEKSTEEKPDLDVIVKEDILGSPLDIDTYKRIKSCARVILVRTYKDTEETFHVIYNRMDFDNNTFINVGINAKNRVSASILYLDEYNHILTFD